ncbi:hypothetical protein [Pseudomonas sp. LA5]|uniref:hypothetical protein n=1 Tax=Pseudomonas sp. LA5 TaxID=3027850 RepID=UPI00235FA30C|nr:hypothetical protein [Pseudomonas sp. LA5]
MNEQQLQQAYTRHCETTGQTKTTRTGFEDFKAGFRLAQPAAGEPVYQCKKKGGVWHDVSKHTYDSVFAGEEFEKRTLWTAPPAAAHGDEAVLWELLEALRTATDRQALPGEFIRVMWEAGCDWINARAAMRAQGGGETLHG